MTSRIFPPFRMLSATNILVVLNVLAYIWEVTTGGLTSDRALIDHGAIYGPGVAAGQWWRIVTGAFLHGGLLHIALNMFALFQVGTFLEMLVGPRRMLITYFVSMIGSGIAVVAFNYDQATVGASGAIFGIFGALAAIGLRLGKPGRGLVQQTVPIILLNLGIGFTIPNISSVGHIGGLVSGFVTGLALLVMHKAPEQPADLVRIEESEERPRTTEAEEPQSGHAPDEPTPEYDETVPEQGEPAEEHDQTR